MAIAQWTTDGKLLRKYRWSNAGLMLVQRLRRWSNIKTALAQRIGLTVWPSLQMKCNSKTKHVSRCRPPPVFSKFLFEFLGVWLDEMGISTNRIPKDGVERFANSGTCISGNDQLTTSYPPQRLGSARNTRTCSRTTLKYVDIKYGDQSVFFQFKISINVLFEYLCYGSRAITKYHSFSAAIEFRRQNQWCNSQHYSLSHGRDRVLPFPNSGIQISKKHTVSFPPCREY